MLPAGQAPVRQDGSRHGTQAPITRRLGHAAASPSLSMGNREVMARTALILGLKRVVWGFPSRRLTRSLMALYLMANSSRSARLWASRSSTRDSSCCRMRFSSWRDSGEDMAPATGAAGQAPAQDRGGVGGSGTGVGDPDPAPGWGNGPRVGIQTLGQGSSPRMEIQPLGWGSSP